MITLDSLIVRRHRRKVRLLLSHQPQIEKYLKRLVFASEKGIASFMLFADERHISELIQTNFPWLLDNEKISIHHAEDHSASSDAFGESGFKWTMHMF